MGKRKMERVDEMKDWLREEKEELAKERIKSMKAQGKEEDFSKTLEQWILGKEGGSLVIAFLRSSYLTKSHKFYMGYYEGEPFVEEEIQTIFYPLPSMFQEVKEDIILFRKKLEKRFPRILPSEEEEIRRWYMEHLYRDMGQVWEEFFKRKGKEGNLPVFYGGYMEELIQIGKI